MLGERLPAETYGRYGASILPKVGWIEPLLRRGPPVPLPPPAEIEVGAGMTPASRAASDSVSSLTGLRK